MAIQARSVSDYDLVWQDKGSGGHKDGSFWRPKLSDGWSMLGDTGVAGYAAPLTSTIIVKNGNDAAALMHPTGYIQIWNDRKSGSHWDGSFWTPIPPSGYKACGTVTMRNHQQPPLDAVMCVKESYVEQGNIGALIWDDSGTGAANDFGAWQIVANSKEAITLGTFYGAPSHSANRDVFNETTGHVLKISSLILPGLLTLDELHTAIQKYGPVLRVHPDEQYLPTCVEYFAENGLLLNNTTKQTSPIDLENIPAGAEYQLELKDEQSRRGDFGRAVVYVHAQPAGSFHTDVQFWFFYSYNGPGTARVKWLVFDSTVHAGNPSLAPLGEHEGDWEHVTIRLSNGTHQPEQMCYYQHGDAHWAPFDAVPKQGTQPVVYASKNGHASYWSTGSNYSEHHKYSVGLTALEFFLWNDTADGGLSLDCSKKYEIIDASYLGKNAPQRPKWVDYRGRWGANINVHLTSETVRKIIVAAFGPIISNIPTFAGLGALLEVLLPYFVKEDQNGPMAPITDSDWHNDSTLLMKAVSPVNDADSQDDGKEASSCDDDEKGQR